MGVDPKAAATAEPAAGPEPLPVSHSPFSLGVIWGLVISAGQISPCSWHVNSTQISGQQGNSVNHHTFTFND